MSDLLPRNVIAEGVHPLGIEFNAPEPFDYVLFHCHRDIFVLIGINPNINGGSVHEMRSLAVFHVLQEPPPDSYLPGQRMIGLAFVWMQLDVEVGERGRQEEGIEKLREGALDQKEI